MLDKSEKNNKSKSKSKKYSNNIIANRFETLDKTSLILEILVISFEVNIN